MCVCRKCWKVWTLTSNFKKTSQRSVLVTSCSLTLVFSVSLWFSCFQNKCCADTGDVSGRGITWRDRGESCSHGSGSRCGSQCVQVCPEHARWWRSWQETSMNSSLWNRKAEGSSSMSTGSDWISLEKRKGAHLLLVGCFNHKKKENTNLRIPAFKMRHCWVPLIYSINLYI